MRHLLSGLLRCAECGGPLVVVDARCYGCPTHKDRGSAVCGNALRIRRDAVEASLLAGIQSELLSDAAFERFHREYLAEIRRTEPDIEVLKRRLADAERVRGNILAALRAGIITPSVRGELIDAEAAIDAARREIDRAAAGQPARMLPRAREVWRSIIAAIADRARSIPAAREAIRALIGDAVVVRNENGATWCEIAPSQSQSQIAVVAGAGSARYLRAPLRIPITPPPGRGC